MLRIKEKYIAGFKYKGVQYNLDGYPQEKLESLFNGELGQFMERYIDENTIIVDKLIKPEEEVITTEIDEVLYSSGILSPNMKKKIDNRIKKEIAERIKKEGK